MADLMDHVKTLADQIGPRPVSTEEEHQASLYVAQELTDNGLEVDVDEFATPTGTRWPFAVAFLAIAVGTLVSGIGIFVPGISLSMFVVGLILAAAGAFVYSSERSNRPVLSSLREGGVSQNVIARHVPKNQMGMSRRRKIVFVAHIDTVRAQPEVMPALAKQTPIMRLILFYDIIALVALLVVRMLPIPWPDEVDIALWVISLVGAVYLLAAAACIAASRFTTYVAGGNDNASAIAVLLETAKRLLDPAERKRHESEPLELDFDEYETEKDADGEDVTASAEGKADVETPTEMFTPIGAKGAEDAGADGDADGEGTSDDEGAEDAEGGEDEEGAEGSESDGAKILGLDAAYAAGAVPEGASIEYAVADSDAATDTVTAAAKDTTDQDEATQADEIPATSQAKAIEEAGEELAPSDDEEDEKAAASDEDAADIASAGADASAAVAAGAAGVAAAAGAAGAAGAASIKSIYAGIPTSPTTAEDEEDADHPVSSLLADLKKDESDDGLPSWYRAAKQRATSKAEQETTAEEQPAEEAPEEAPEPAPADEDATPRYRSRFAEIPVQGPLVRGGQEDETADDSAGEDELPEGEKGEDGDEIVASSEVAGTDEGSETAGAAGTDESPKTESAPEESPDASSEAAEQDTTLAGEKTAAEMAGGEDAASETTETDATPETADATADTDADAPAAAAEPAADDAGDSNAPAPSPSARDEAPAADTQAAEAAPAAEPTADDTNSSAPAPSSADLSGLLDVKSNKTRIETETFDIDDDQLDELSPDMSGLFAAIEAAEAKKAAEKEAAGDAGSADSTDDASDADTAGNADLEDKPEKQGGLLKGLTSRIPIIGGAGGTGSHEAVKADDSGKDKDSDGDSADEDATTAMDLGSLQAASESQDAVQHAKSAKRKPTARRASDALKTGADKDRGGDSLDDLRQEAPVASEYESTPQASHSHTDASEHSSSHPGSSSSFPALSSQEPAVGGDPFAPQASQTPALGNTSSFPSLTGSFPALSGNIPIIPSGALDETPTHDPFAIETGVDGSSSTSDPSMTGGIQIPQSRLHNAMDKVGSLFGRRKQKDAPSLSSDPEQWDDDDDMGWKGGAFLDESESAFAAAKARIAEMSESVEDMARDDLLDKEVWFVALGASGASNQGMKNFLELHAGELRGALIVNLECVGTGRLGFTETEGLGKRRSDRRIQNLIRSASKKVSGIQMRPRKFEWRNTDATVAMLQGMRAASIMGFDGDSDVPVAWHWASDTADIVEKNKLEYVTRMLLKVIEQS